MKYINFQKVKSIDMPAYNFKQSLRVYMKKFELQAAFLGIEDMNTCTIPLDQFVPPVIKDWLPTQPIAIRQRWDTFKEQLLLQFGKPVEEEYREFKTQLRKCQKGKNESMKLHGAKWHVREANLTTHIFKCQFGMAQINFLGFLVFDQGIQAHPDKVRPIINLPAPTNIKEVERFLGITGVYQKFITQNQVMI